MKENYCVNVNQKFAGKSKKLKLRERVKKTVNEWMNVWQKNTLRYIKILYTGKMTKF